MINLIPYYMIRSLVATLILETGLAAILGVRKKYDVIIVILAQVLTNPIVNAVAMWLNLSISLTARHIAVPFLELFAFLTEAEIYKRVLDYKKINPYVLSLILNGFSFASGFLINYLFEKVGL